MKTICKTVGKVYAIIDLVQDEPIIPQFCSKTEENAKRQFAIFLSQNKFKTADFELRCIGEYFDFDAGHFVCRGSDVMLENYMRSDFESTVSKDKE